MAQGRNARAHVRLSTLGPRPRQRNVRLATLGPRLGTADVGRVRPPAKRPDALYLSAPWRALLAALMRQRGRRCEACGTRHGRIIGDHIREIADGGALLDPTNIRLLCAACHNRKTAKARAIRVSGGIVG